MPLFFSWSHSQQPWPRKQPVQQVCRAAKVTFTNWSALSRPWRLTCRHSAARWVWAGNILGQVPPPPQNLLLSGACLSNSLGALLHPNSHFPSKLSTMRMIRAIIYWGVRAVPHSLHSMSSILTLTFPDRSGVPILEIRAPKPQTVKWIDQGHTVNKWPVVKPHGGVGWGWGWGGQFYTLKTPISALPLTTMLPRPSSKKEKFWCWHE